MTWHLLPLRGPPCRRLLRPCTADQQESPLSLSDRFRFTAHPEHGYVAEGGPQIPSYLADWFLTREQFERLPGASAGTCSPSQNATDSATPAKPSTTYAVSATASPLSPSAPPRPLRDQRMYERRSRLARAAARSSPRSGPTPAASAPSVRPNPPAYAPADHLPGVGRSR